MTPATRGAHPARRAHRLEARTARLQRALHRLERARRHQPRSRPHHEGDPRADPSHAARALARAPPRARRRPVQPLLGPHGERGPDTDQDDELIATAHASAWHWLQVGTHGQPVARATGCAPASTRSSAAPSPRCSTPDVASRSSRAAARASRTGTPPGAYEAMARALAVERRPATARRNGRRRRPLALAAIAEVEDRDADRGRSRHAPRLTRRSGRRPVGPHATDGRMHDLKLGVLLWNQATDWPSYIDAVRRVDRLGYAHLWAWDHLYAIFGDPYQPIFEGWASLAASAMATEQTRLGLLVGANTFRNPGLVAKLAVDARPHLRRSRDPRARRRLDGARAHGPRHRLRDGLRAAARLAGRVRRPPAATCSTASPSPRRPAATTSSTTCATPRRRCRPTCRS